MVIFLLGAAMSGKSYIRKEIFEGIEYVDIYDYQKEAYEKLGENYEALIKAEENMLKDLIKKIKKKKPEDIIILEHLLSNDKRRKEYIKKIKKVTDEEIICLFVKPNEEDKKELIRRRLKEDTKLKGKKLEKEIDNRFEVMQSWYECAKIPSKEDGFDHSLVVIPIIGGENA